MDFNQSITIFSVIITVLSVIIAMYQIYQSNKDYLSINQGRRQAISGKWAGNFKQDNRVEYTDLTGIMELHLEAKGKIIKGKGFYRGNFGQSVSNYQENIVLYGGFKGDRFLALEYHNQNPEKVHFGNYILELSANGDRLTGKLIGYGNKSEKIIAADLELLKKST